MTTLFDRKDFSSMLKELEKFSKDREKVILFSREVIRLSKQLIYSVHRKDFRSAEKHSKDIKKKYNLMVAEIKKNSYLYHIGAYKVAVQEYVEAICYFEYVKNKKIPTSKQLNASTEYYLMGLCDLTGELVRLAINAGINEDYKVVVEVKILVEELYCELMRFDFSGGELRKKFDSIKYDLNKLENIVYDLKIKEKI